MLKKSLIAALLGFAAIPVYAQYYDRPMECWNPGAGHFEAVRPGEYQNDLDMNRCRPLAGGNYYRGEAYRYEQPRYDPRTEPRYYGRSDVTRECWNPRAGHFENVREGTYQNDLDYSRCRYR